MALSLPFVHTRNVMRLQIPSYQSRYTLYVGMAAISLNQLRNAAFICYNDMRKIAKFHLLCGYAIGERLSCITQ